MENGEFVKDDRRRLPVADRYLLPILSPSSPGTNYWDPPPPGPLNDRQRGRILLQVHQILDLFRQYGIDLKGKTFLDVGTGNGLVPRLLLELSDLNAAVGVDPYHDGGHKTSWQPHDHDETLRDLRAFIVSRCPGALDLTAYDMSLGYEAFASRPSPVGIAPQPPKAYMFSPLGAHDLDKLGADYDICYCKAIEHIPDWDGVLRAMARVTRENGIVYFKHRSFFSYLGPHRYAASNIPWGHVLLTDAEYRRFASEFHGRRVAAMTDFYFTGLAYPRTTVSGLLRHARTHGLVPFAILNESPRYIATVAKFIDEVPDFWAVVNDNYPDLSAEEMFSGIYHILLRRA
jgi:SAM-dependent methyltransferase